MTDGTYKVILTLIDDSENEYAPTKGIQLQLFKSDMTQYGAVTYSLSDAISSGLPLVSSRVAYIKVINYLERTNKISKFGIFVDSTNYQEYTTKVRSEQLYALENKVNDNMTVAPSSGFAYPHDTDISMYVSHKNVSNWSVDNHSYTLSIGQYDSEIVNVNVYGTFSIDITELFGKNAKIHFDVHNSNYSGNLSTSWVLNEFHITTTKNDWAGNIKTISSSKFDMGSVDTVINIYLDKLGIKYESYSTPLYLVIGAHDKHKTVSNYNPPTDITITPIITTDENRVIATEISGFDTNDYYTKTEVDNKLKESGNYITCWGDSLTAGGGWTTKLGELAGMTVYNGGTGGESTKTIIARQGADIMLVNDITIPADTTAVTIASRSTDGGITTYEGNKVTPLLQGGAHVNPCKIGDILGTLKWTGSTYADTNGTWTFTRSVAGEKVTINRPTAIRTDFDMNKNAPYLAVIFIGQNGGYSNLDDLVRQHRLMIEHSNAKHTIVLGLSSGSASDRADYETRMKKEFGRYFISLREYLSHPIYNSDGEIISCYGLADQDLEPNNTYTYNGVTYDALAEIATGTVPHMILADNVHYTTGTKTVIGNMLYTKCKELNIF